MSDGIPVEIQTSVIPDGVSWIVEAVVLKLGDREMWVPLPGFAVQATTAEEAVSKAQEILATAKITLRSDRKVRY